MKGKTGVMSLQNCVDWAGVEMGSERKRSVRGDIDLKWESTRRREGKSILRGNSTAKSPRWQGARR